MTSTTTLKNAHKDIVELAGKYLTFQLDSEVYGLEILKVQEIIGVMRVTPVPRTPDFIRGVVNLRGKVIPITDLRKKFGMESIPDTERTCIIVAQISRGLGAITMGIIVDEVSEVLDVQASQLEAPPSFGTSVDTEFLLAMGKVGQKVILLLDVNRVLTDGELNLISNVAEA
jgi:purine-binding chemotaxis protein CheW